MILKQIVVRWRMDILFFYLLSQLTFMHFWDGEWNIWTTNNVEFFFTKGDWHQDYIYVYEWDVISYPCPKLTPVYFKRRCS